METPEDSLPLQILSRQRPAPPSPRKGWIVWIAGFASLLIAGAFIAPSLFSLRPAASVPATQSEETAPEQDWIAALGHLEPAGGIIAVAPPRLARDATVTAIIVSEGEVVAEGDALATLETLSRSQAELARAEAEVGLRSAELARARRTIAADKADAAAQVASATSRLMAAERDLSRAVQLVASDTLSAVREEELRTTRDTLAADLARTEALELRLQGPVDSHPDVVAAEAALAAARAARDIAVLAVNEATVRAPAPGRIVAIPARIGEPAPADGIVRLAAAGPVVAILEVHQDRIQRVRLGAHVMLRAPAVEGELTGTISRIGQEVQRQSVFANDPAANTDARVFAVEATLDSHSSMIAADLLNLQVLARISTRANE